MPQRREDTIRSGESQNFSKEFFVFPCALVAKKISLLRSYNFLYADLIKDCREM